MKSMWTRAAAPVVAAIALSSASCSGSGQSESRVDSAVTEEYHADYDIVMAVKSLIDAANVGEPFDSATYTYEAVLTDGAGRPLYTDMQGSPGMWQVRLEAPGNVSFSNVYLGDLLPSDLETYLIAGLPLTSADRKQDEDLKDDLTSLSVYDIGAGVLRFETRTGRTSGELEGPLMTIRVIALPQEDNHITSSPAKITD